jgi:hypothetical protein
MVFIFFLTKKKQTLAFGAAPKARKKSYKIGVAD